MAIRQNLQLEELSYEYELFRANQLLTHEQINKFIRYFEDQDRLTRTCLIGVGLVCGLAARFKNNTLSLSTGCAVTTDGDLLKVETTDYKFFSAYANRTRGKGDPIYDPFFPPAQEDQVPLWEMKLSDQVEVGTPPEPLSSFKSITGHNVEDMVCLLYLEYYLREPDDCTAIDCDQLGQLQHAQIKVLLLAQSDLDKVINSEPTEIIADHIYKSYYEAYEQYFELPELHAPRLVLNRVNSASLAALSKSYYNIIKGGAAELITAIDKLYHTFQFILDPKRYFKIDWIKSQLSGHLSKTVKVYQMQYVYSFYKDLIDAYNEIRNTIYHAIYICCPDKYAFPKHIMLGIVNDDLGPRPPRYRHNFYPSPAVTKNRSYLSVAKSMFNRLNDMTNGFYLPEESAIKVTPSADRPKTMEYRSIPFYYNNVKQLVQHWSYYRTMRGTDTGVLSYHSSKYSSLLPTLNPLNYSIENYTMFRIEGHLGKKMQESMEAILSIRDNNSLPFEVVAVRMDERGQLSINLEDYACQFDDLNAVLNAWIVEQDCLYAKTVDYFSSFDNTGKNIKPKAKGRLDFSWLAAAKGTKSDSRLTNFSLYLDTSKGQKTSNQLLGEQKNRVANYSYQNFYQVDDTVDNNLNKTEGTIGSVFMKARKNESFWLGDAYIGMILEWGLSDAVISALSTDVREIAFNIPVRIIARINDVTRYKPFEIADLDQDVLENYQDAIENLCNEASTSLVKAEAIFAKSDYKPQGFEADYRSTLRSLSENCCAADKLQALMEEIKSRKQKIIDSLSFANYSAKHPGLEHKSGVPYGGTFVLVYATTSAKTPNDNNKRLEGNRYNNLGVQSIQRTSQKRKIADFYEQDEDSFLMALLDASENYDTQKIIGEYVQFNGYSISSITGKVKMKNLLGRAAELASLLELERTQRVSNETVVADFCLPYLCCSDCAPMVFVLPAKKHTLALPQDEACSNTGLLPFKRDPVDGLVQATAGFENTIGERQGTVYFDASKVKPEDYGKEISFTINGQITECSIIVWKHPTAKASYRILKDDRSLLEVVFTNESDDDTGKEYSYEWNFGDGTPVQTKNNKDSIVYTYKKEAFANEPLIKVTMQAHNHSCSSDVLVLELPVKQVDNPDPPDNSCIQQMNTALDTDRKMLLAYVEKVDDPAFQKVVSKLLKQYALASSLLQQPDDAAAMNNLLDVLSELMRSLYSMEVGSNYPEETTEVMRILLRLPLQLTRCTPKRNEAVDKMLSVFYEAFVKGMQRQQRLLFATINANNSMTEYISQYRKDTSVTNKNLVDALNKVLKLLALFTS